MAAACRFLAGNALERLGMAANNAALVGCDIFRAYLEELQLLGMPVHFRVHSRFLFSLLCHSRLYSSRAATWLLDAPEMPMCWLTPAYSDT